MSKKKIDPYGAVGVARPKSPIRNGRYIGPEPHLKGKTALVSSNHTAQFDDMATGLGHGWWQFKATDFEEIKR